MQSYTKWDSVQLYHWYVYSVIILPLMEIYTYDQMETCDIMNEDFAIFKKPKTTQEANTETKTKYVVPKLGIRDTPGPTGLQKKAARNSTSFHRRPKRSQAKISVKKAQKITKTEANTYRPSLSHKRSIPHQKGLTVPNSQLQYTGSHCDVEEHKAVVTTKQQQGRILSKKSLLQNRALLLSNTDPHDSNLQCHEENTSTRYSRRMPVFLPVSSSHANAQPVTSNQCRISLVGDGRGQKARFTRPTERQSVEGKFLLNSPKLSVVSLKLPNIM